MQLRNNDRLLAELCEANQSLTDRLESLSRSLRGGGGGGGGQQSLSSSPGHHPQTSSSSQGNNNSQNAISLLGELEQLSSADSDYSTMATTASRTSSFLGGRNSSCRRCDLLDEQHAHGCRTRTIISRVFNFRQCSQIEEMPEEDEEDIEADFDDSEMTTTAIDPSEMKEVRESAIYKSNPSFTAPLPVIASRGGVVRVPAAEVALPRPQEAGAGEGPGPAAAAARAEAAPPLVGVDGQRILQRPRHSVKVQHES